MKSDVKNKSDFKTNVPENMPRSEGIQHPAALVDWCGIGPGAALVCRAWSVPRNNRSHKSKDDDEDQDPKNKNKVVERTTTKRQRKRMWCRGSDTPRTEDLANYLYDFFHYLVLSLRSFYFIYFLYMYNMSTLRESTGAAQFDVQPFVGNVKKTCKK